jgi:hypothetical protein
MGGAVRREASSIVSRAYRPGGRDASTSTASGFRLRMTDPRRGQAGTTLNPDTDEVYRWYSRCSSPPRSRDACGRRVSQHTPGRTHGRNDRTGTPLVRALALHGVSSTETFGRGSHLDSTLNPGRAVLTGGVFRRSGSVACVRADASPSEVLAPSMVDDQIRCRQAY